MDDLVCTLKYGTPKEIIRNRLIFASVIESYSALIAMKYSERNTVCEEIYEEICKEFTEKLVSEFKAACGDHKLDEQKTKEITDRATARRSGERFR